MACSCACIPPAQIVNLTEWQDQQRQNGDISANGDLPPHFRKNKAIQRGYPVVKSWKECLSTLVHLNNETFNVYTCILWMFIMVGLSANIIFASGISSDIQVSNHLIGIGLFMVNLILTSGYHLFCPLPHVYHLWSAIDLLGIGIAIFSMALTLFLHGFQLPIDDNIMAALHVHPEEQDMWWKSILLVTIGSSIFCSGLRLAIQRESPIWVHVLNTWSSAVIILPLYMYHRFAVSTRAQLSVSLLISGIACFLLKFPEKSSHFRSRFDIFGHSHMLWHTLYQASFYMFFTDMFIAKTNRPELLWDSVIMSPFGLMWTEHNLNGIFLVNVIVATAFILVKLKGALQPLPEQKQDNYEKKRVE